MSEKTQIQTLLKPSIVLSIFIANFLITLLVVSLFIIQPKNYELSAFKSNLDNMKSENELLTNKNNFLNVQLKFKPNSHQEELNTLNKQISFLKQKNALSESKLKEKNILNVNLDKINISQTKKIKQLEVELSNVKNCSVKEKENVK